VALLAEYEASLAMSDAALADAVADLEAWEDSSRCASGDDPVVPCPVCHRRRLLASPRGVLFCGCGGIRRVLAAQGTGTLAFAAQRLAGAWEEHARGGCPAQPVFTQIASLMGGGDTLWAACDTCQALMAVL
jgi:hypothetical protein